jgi:hypothetical protein
MTNFSIVEYMMIEALVNSYIKWLVFFYLAKNYLVSIVIEILIILDNEINMICSNVGTSRNLEVELNDIGSMDIFGDAQMLTYL